MAFQSLQLPPGIQRNATPYDTPNRWWDVNLVRWQSGTMRPIGGWQRLSTTAFNTPARLISVYRDNSNIRHVLVGTDDKLYYDSGNDYTDITPTSFLPLSTLGLYGGYGTFAYGYDPNPVNDVIGPPLVMGKGVYGRQSSMISTLYAPVPFWSMSNWGEDVILTSNSDGRLFYYVSSTPSVKPVAITGSYVPTGNTSVVVTDERHVMAVGSPSNDQGTKRRLRWSSRESYTDWDYTSTTNTAGYLDLDARSPLLKGVKVREGVLVFSSSEAFLVRYIGTPFIYNADRIAETSIMNAMSIASYNGKAAWMGKNGFWRYEGGFLTPLDCPILNDIFESIDQNYGAIRSFASNNGTYPEIWWFYPTEGNSENNRYVCWNYQEDWWSWGELSRTAMAPGETYLHPYMGGADKYIYEHEVGYTNSGSPRASNGMIYAETGALPLTNGDRGVNINQVLPANDHGAASMAVQFYSKQTPEGAERSFGPYYARTDGYTDCRVAGRDIRIRLEATQDAEWSVGKMRFNTQPGSGR